MEKLNPLQMALDAGPVVQATILLLVFMSIVSVGIMFGRRMALARYRRMADEFRSQFGRARTLGEAKKAAESRKGCSAAAVFLAFHAELDKQLALKEEGGRPVDLTSLERALEHAIAAQVGLSDKGLGFLASTASSAPFIGLFGTVWGIMTAFHDIGQRGQASLATVAPGISEALIVTALGLATAIPALLGFNYFQRRLKTKRADLYSFGAELLNEANRRFDAR